MPVLHVIDANAPWVRSLVNALPDDWTIRHYRIYNPLWLPGGMHDVSRLGRWKRLDERTEEIYLVTPGWRCFESLSTAILNAFLPSRKTSSMGSVFLFTFPYYSAVAAIIRKRLPASLVAYWAHDAFAYYGFAPGYVNHHEELLVPLCDARFAMAPQLVRDYAKRYPEFPFELLHDGVSEDFISAQKTPIPCQLDSIHQLGGPVVGCIGQINGSYDWNLLEAASAVNPKTQFVFIGNLFEEGEITESIRRFFARKNVHWLGRLEHDRLPSFLRGFDICLNPLAVSDHNHRRDPLRIYDYLTTEVPIFSTDLDGVRMHREHVDLFESPESLISRLAEKPAALNQSVLESRRAYITSHTWKCRARQFADHVMGEAGAQSESENPKPNFHK